MTSYFPDLNVWVALSVSAHVHWADSQEWLDRVSPDSRIIFSRYTQVGLLRLLTTQAVMGSECKTLNQAWDVYDYWLNDPRIELWGEPGDLNTIFREATIPLGAQRAPKMVGDSFLLAYAEASGGALVTFDRALRALAARRGIVAISPG